MGVERAIFAGPKVVVSCATQSTNKICILQLLDAGAKIEFIARSEVEAGDAVQNYLSRSAGIRNQRGNSQGGCLKNDEAEGFVPERRKDQCACCPKVLDTGRIIYPACNGGIRVNSSNLFSERAGAHKR